MLQAPCYVIPLHKVRELDAAEVGAKALNLARMLRAGLPVPDGFCVTAAAYRAHFGPERQKDIRQEVGEWSAATPDERFAHLAATRAWLRMVSEPDEVEKQVVEAFDRLGTCRVAVRSSGTAEDLPCHSFAGLYDTFLEHIVLGLIMSPVKRCWTSVWTDRAFEYREKNGFDHFKAGMAVVVQRLVTAQASGLAFTADPVTGARGRITIESCVGLGPALVSGQVSPDRFILGRTRLEVLERTIALKQVESSLDVGECRQRPLFGERARNPSISDDVAKRAARLALRAEKMFGTPQDVEWAFDGRKVWLVQARPITTIRQRTWEDRQVWSNTNAAEVLPGVLTPLVWSTIGEYIGELLGGVIARLGISFGEHPFTGEVAGRIYTNLNTFTGLVRRMPFAGRMSQAQMFGGRNLKPEDRVRLELGEDDLPDIKVSPLKTLLKLPGFMLWMSRHGPGRGRKWIAAAISAYEQKPRPDLARCSEAELSERAVTTLAQMRVGSEGLGYALGGMMFTSVLYDLCRRWFNDATGINASRLLAGTGELHSAEAGVALWRLARSAAASAEVKTALLSSSPWSELRPRFDGSDPGRDFLVEWDSFMHRHGHHARGEMDMFNPRWREQPDYVIEIVRNFLCAEGRTDPEADRLRHADEREQLGARLLARLRNPVKRWVFRYVVRQAQLSAAIRENVKDAGIRIIADARELVVELGRRLASRGVLARADDLFFLRLEEIAPVVAGVAGFDVRGRVAERRAEYDRNLALTPPAIVVGKYDPARHKPDVLDSTSFELNGLAVSPGVVTGPARVILHAGVEQVLPGEILVAPFTDPGWTPYFIPAAGIVVDQGGLLSHGSIVAREYGIPAVVNVGPATKLIKTGQMVEVDGDAGRVRILGQV